MSRLLGLLVGVLSGWLGGMSFGAAVAAPVSPVAVYTYDGQESCAADCSDSSERGPPVHASSASTPGAVDRGSRRTSARLALPTTGAAATIYYDATSMLVQVAHATATTQGHPHGAEAALSSITRSDVAANSGMAGVRATGAAGETAAGIVKNTTRIPAASGNAAYRIPDELNSSVLGEVKNVKSLGWSSQISDFYSYASARGLEFRLYVRPDTVFRGQLAELYKYNGFTRVDVPGMGP